MGPPGVLGPPGCEGHSQDPAGSFVTLHCPRERSMPAIGYAAWPADCSFCVTRRGGTCRFGVPGSIGRWGA
jgi:hypothetical protein